MKKIANIVGGVLLVASTAGGMYVLDRFSKHDEQVEASAKIQLRDSLDLTTEQYSKLLKNRQSPSADCFNCYLEKVGTEKIKELSPTPKVFDSAITLVNTGKQTYATVYNNMKKAMTKAIKK